ncbi:T9SS type A sorting domain-containing protein (plasmid) [Pedobacter sp. BS3]|uniref:T9SS type A sorting domain-containing protein n=1 Tax=Pedobacter sp. BS3 TaxID=2567937 RepID=UPI0011EEF5FB|nr:T9SS type A sorting domain-containing protein [Pedobacter sp. BS3]TZF86286.1 T9SS type A sorting domain-containing protein [Pedobacter sp. BS3]
MYTFSTKGYGSSGCHTLYPLFNNLKRWLTLICLTCTIAIISLNVSQAAGVLFDLSPDRHLYVKEDGSATADGSSWDQATTLDNALQIANSGDVIHIAAGTYRPASVITNGTASELKDYTFEIRTNVQLIGGYPANAQDGAQPDPETNPTILNGNLGTAKARHVVTVSAVMEEGKQVSLQGLTIREGEAGGSGTVTINGTAFSRAHGGGMIIGNARVSIDNCQIIENTTNNHAAGMYVTNQAIVTIKNSSISKNSATRASSNGGGMWNDGSTIYLYNSTISENRIGGVGGGIYAINTTRTSYTYMYNVTIANNVTGIFGANSAAAGYYGREQSQGVMVNCTVYGNKAGGTGAGGGIQLYGSAKLDVISSTIVNNSGAVGSASVAGSGINVTTNGTNILNLYNTIVAGNTGSHGQIEGSVATTSSTIIGDKVYDADGNIIASATFDAATMLNILLLPVGEDNPALTYGMSASSLTALGNTFSPPLENLIASDMNGNSRSDKSTMGALVIDPLPVSLVTFTASLQDNAVNLAWHTASESNNAGFYIERSNDLRQWRTLTFVLSKGINGTSNVSLTYAYTDHAPNTGNNYYRLRQKDYDGASSYSDIKVIPLALENEIVCYPNPVAATYTIKAQQLQKVALYNAGGKRLSVKTNLAGDMATMDVSSLSAGVYVAKIQRANTVKAVKVIINR